jgi:hypothetical protein
MLDTAIVTQMIEKQIATQVNEQVLAVFTSDQWLDPLEQKILKYTQDRILAKFASSDSMPEIITAVKNSVAEMFDHGMIPGIEQFVESDKIKHAVDQAVEQIIQSAVSQFGQDPLWQAQVERLINQAITQETISRLGSIDLGTIIKRYVDENMSRFTAGLLENFASSGIVDQANKCELTVMDDAVVVENVLHAHSIQVLESVRVQDLVVTGSVNTDNKSWSALSDHISQKTLDKLTDQWNKSLVDQVVKQVQEHGISFDQIRIGEQTVINGPTLASMITESNLQTLGTLKTLTVSGEARFNNNTVNVLNRRVGINNDAPEKALSVWDEEVSIVIGKHKQNQAYLGTNRDQSVVIGVNREPQIEISTNGLTTIKQLQVGLHKISHASQVPGWSGTRGDIVFNSSPGSDRVFAWVCLGAHKWQTLKSAE